MMTGEGVASPSRFRSIKTYGFGQIMFEAVTPAPAGVQVDEPQNHWIPACAGMTPTSIVT